MAAADEFALVAATLDRTLGVLRREAATPRQQNRGRALANHVALLCEAVAQHLADRRAAFAQTTDPVLREAAVVDLQLVLAELRKQQRAVQWLRASERSPLDLGTRYFVDHLARQVVSAEVEVTVVAADDASYATVSNPYRPAIENWGPGIPPGEPTVVVVLIPRREERSGLLHPLIVHELGHAADLEHDIVESIIQVARNDPAFEGEFKAAAAQLAAKENKTVQEAGDVIQVRLLGWARECFCDCLATLALGPTYLYAFAAEVTSEDLDTPGEVHPPPRARVEAMLELLDADGWSPAMDASDPVLDTWIRTYASTASAYDDPETYLLSALRSLSDQIRQAAEARLGAVFSPDAALDEVVELLSAGIPPAQLADSSAAPREAIILAGWWEAIRKSGGGPAGLAAAPERPELAELLPAALELAALTAAWNVTAP